MKLNLAAIASFGLNTSLESTKSRSRVDAPPPPEPEPISLTTLPLPPVVNSSDIGACTSAINPNGTGCMVASSSVDFQAGAFLPDGKHVLVFLTFSGAPLSPNPSNIYNGSQIVALKTNGEVFPHGDAWKCLTCGVPHANALGVTPTFDYPQAFHDGKRILFGTNILDCGAYDLVSKDCTAERTRIYPIRWNVNPDGSGRGGPIRELRLHPDNVHLGYSSFTSIDGKLGQFSYFGRLEFNSQPSAGMPLVPRYDLINVTRLFNPELKQPVETNGSSIIVNRDAITVGELRGFSSRGDEAAYLGYPAESSNIDVFAVHLQTGHVRRLTSHPEYCDPMAFSPDDNWIVVEDTRGTNRQMWLSGMRDIPPITDLISTSVTSSTRNNGQRRFFKPYLLDRFGDRGEYYGQKLSPEGDGIPGSGDYNDPEWNAMADPAWSPDGTQIVYWEAQTSFPACDGSNPLSCYPSREPGGRRTRVVLATLTSRKPLKSEIIQPVSDEIPWGIAYVAGEAAPARTEPSPGNHTMYGQSEGYADIELVDGAGGSINEVGVTYHNYSDDGLTFLNGFERVKTMTRSQTLTHIDWYSDILQSGKLTGRKKTSADGFHLEIDVLTNIFNANGTLSTTIDGNVYLQPANGT